MNAREPLLTSKGGSGREVDDTFLLEPGNRNEFRSGSEAVRSGLGSGASNSALRDGLRSAGVQPGELQAAHNARATAEKQLQECRQEFEGRLQESDAQRKELKARLQQMAKEMAALQEGRANGRQRPDAKQGGPSSAASASASPSPRGCVSFHAAATPERDPSRSLHRGGGSTSSAARRYSNGAEEAGAEVSLLTQSNLASHNARQPK